MNSINCYHCDLPVTEPANFFVEIEGQTRAMCCPGCQAVASAIVDGGLENFYRFRDANNQRPSSAIIDFGAYDLPELQDDFVGGDRSERHAKLLLEGITCAACVWLIEKHLSAIAGVLKISVNSTSHRCHVVFDAERVTLSFLMSELARIGYSPLPASDENQRSLWLKESRALLMRLGVAGFGMMQVMMVAFALYAGALQDFDGIWQNFFRWVSLIVATPVVVFSAQPFFRAALNSLRQRRLIMDVPVALAIGSAYLASVWATLAQTGEVYFESVSMFTFFLLLGRFLEMRLRHKNANGLRHVALRLPLTARRNSNAADAIEEIIPLKRLRVGDRVKVLAGEILPCDGVVLEGTTRVDEALLTGESVPIAKCVGDRVIAGSVNLDSLLWITTEAVGENTQLSAIEQMVARAEAEKPVEVGLADRWARAFVARLLLVALGVAGFWLWHQPEQAFWVTLSVLVVTCPCALSLATPVALTQATLWLREHGLLVTRGHVIESLARVDTVVFDKTGTLTQGDIRLNSVLPLTSSCSECELLSVVAALESGSTHPLAKAFRHYPPAQDVSDQVQYPSQGVEGRVQMQLMRFGKPAFFQAWYQAALLEPPDELGQWLLLGNESMPLAWFEVSDALREDALQTVTALRDQNLDVYLLSGDRAGVVADLALQLGITEAHGDLLPEDKLAKVQALQAQGRVVLMVGDGINDVPVLAGANVSVAMAGATDLAQARADSLLTNGRLMTLVHSLALAQACKHTIAQNLLWAVGYNVLALPFAALGWVPPYAAAAGMSLSSLVVVVNALRLGRKLSP